MVFTKTSEQTHQLFPESLKRVVLSRAPENRIGISLLPIPQELNGSEHEIANQWLTRDEQKQMDKYTFAKRKLEWLSGRICAKTAALDLLSKHDEQTLPSASEFSIQSSPSGRPYLDPATFSLVLPGVDISISHSHTIAIGLAGYGRCGIDIQYVNDTLFKVKHRFCSDLESVLLDQLPAEELTQLGLLWVAKEAVRKSFSETRIVGFTELVLARADLEEGHYLLHFQPDIEGISFPGRDLLPVICHYSNSYALAISLQSKKNNHA